MSCNLSFIFDCPIICKTVKYINKLDNSYWYIYSQVIAEWSVENMNHDIDMTPKGMLLVVRVSTKMKIKNDATNI
jgi:hypothetical protein